MIPDITYLYSIIDEVETKERKNSKDWDEIQFNARCAGRMKAWEKLLYWALDGIEVS